MLFLARSDYIGTTNVTQGGTYTAAQSGDYTSCAIMDYNNGASSGTLSTWLITPQTDFSTGATLTFFTRTSTASSFADRMYVRYSTSGSSIDVGSTANSVGSFTNQLLVLNENLVKGGYPEEWTQYTLSVPAQGAGVSGRFAFQYHVTNGGVAGLNSYFVAIDTVVISLGCALSSGSSTTGSVSTTGTSSKISYIYCVLIGEASGVVSTTGTTTGGSALCNLSEGFNNVATLSSSDWAVVGKKIST